MGERSTDAGAPRAADEGSAHAQAVRFLTSLRSEQAEMGNDSPSAPLTLTDDQRAFLRAKGLDDAAIERARAEAERPALLPSAPGTNSAQDVSPFESAARAFDAPDGSRDSAPAVPVPTYPRSPLALYQAAAAPRRDANDVLSKLAASMSKPRYDVLVSFFRMLHAILLLGGGASAVLVLLYRRYLIPRMTATVDAQKNLVTLQSELFAKMGESMKTLLAVPWYKLKPPGYEPQWIEEAEAQDEAEAAPEDAEKPAAPDGAAPEGDAPAAPTAEKPAAPAAEATAAPTDPEASPADHPDVALAPRRRLAPVDITQSLRESLDRLADALRATRAPRTTPTASVTDDDDEGLVDLSPDDGSAPAARVAPVATPGMTALRSALDASRSDIRAQLLADDDLVSVMGNRFSAFVQPTPRASSGPAVEMMQIKAEIRSLKGLMLSRRNFPSYLRSARAATPSATPSS